MRALRVLLFTLHSYNSQLFTDRKETDMGTKAGEEWKKFLQSHTVKENIDNSQKYRGPVRAATDQGQKVSKNAPADLFANVPDLNAGKQAASEPKLSAFSPNLGLNGTKVSQEALYSASLKKQAEEAERKYQDYVSSSEGRGNQLQAVQAAEQERRFRQMAGADASMPGLDAWDEKERTLRAEADYWKARAAAQDDQTVMEKDMKELAGWPEEDQKALALYVTNRNRDANLPTELSGNPFLKTAEQEAAELIRKYGRQKVDELAESYARSENREAARMVAEKAQEGAGGSIGGAIGHSAASVGANMAGGLTGVLGYMQELGRRTGRYSTLDPDNAGNLLNVYSGAVREEVAQNIENSEALSHATGALKNALYYAQTGGLPENAAENVENGGALLGKIGSIAYQGGMSAADSLARVAAAGGAGSLGLAAAGSFSQTLSDASRQGATPQQAMILATANAAIETLSEKIPLDSLLDTMKGGKQSIGKVIRAALAQAGIEASTEEVSLVGSLFAEALVLREKSDYNQQIGDMVANGMSYSDAKAQADKAVWDEAVNTFYVSAASGGMSSLGGSLFANAATPDGVQETAQTVQNGETAQTGQGPVQTENAPLGAAGTLEAVDILGDAVEKLNANGTVSNKTAEAILSDPGAVQRLAEQTGVEISGTKSQQRDAVKQALRQLAGEGVPATLSAEGAQSLIEDLGQGMWENSNAAQEQAMQPQDAEPGVSPEAQRLIEQTLGIPQQTDVEISGVDSQGIEMGMPEEARQQVLGGKKIHVVEDTNSASHAETIQSVESLPARAKSKVEKIIKPLAVKLGILNRTMKTPEVEVDFTFSTGGLTESMHKQLRYGGSYADFAKTMINLDKVLENAVLIEKHGDKYAGTSRADRNLENVYVLFGAFRDGDNVIPVQMEIKKTSDYGSRLYMTVAMTKIEADVLGRTIGRRQASSLISASEYSLPELFQNINPTDKHFLKYLPDGFLSNEQKQAKQSALQEDADRIATYKVSQGQNNGIGPDAVPKKESGASANDLRRLGQPEAKSTPNSTDSIQGNGPEVNGDLLYGNVPTEFLDHGAVGAAERDFTGMAAYDDLLSDQNAQRDRPNDVRSVEVPKTDSYGRKVSEFVGNAYGAEVTPDRMVSEIESLVQEGALGFDSRANQESLENARNYIYGSGEEKGKGEAKTRSEITKNIANGRIQDGDIEKAILLYAKYANRKSQSSQENAAELMVDLATMANMTGRNLQLFKLLRRMTPEGQLMTVQKTVGRNVEKMVKSGQIQKGYEPDIDQSLMDDYLGAAKENLVADTLEKQKQAEQRLKDVENAIYLNAAAQMPATFKAKWDAWRYMCMLGNAKTQVRNLVGNAAFMPYTEAKRVIGAALERTIPKDQRTKAVLNPLSQEDRRLRAWAGNDTKSEDVSNALQYSAKLGDDVSMSVIQENRRIFNSEILENARKLSEAMPAKGDMLFKNREYAASLAGFLKARGYTAGDIEAGKVSDTVLNEGREYAINEAMKATFNDCNAFSDALANGLRYKGDNAFLKALNTLGEGVMPFRRTPANIVVRMVENSPVGLAKGAWDMATKVHKGDVSAATAIDQLAAGLTGTGALVLGYALAKGVGGVKLRGSDVDEDEKRRGYQAYALEFSIGGKEYSYTIDWAAPANLPLFIGANLYSLMENAGADTGLSKFTSFLYSTMTAFEPMLSLSCMSSLNDLLEAGKYAGEGEALYSVLAQAATSYFTQGIPTLLRQTAQALQENKQSTFANSDDPLIRDMQRTAAGIPGVGSFFQTDAVDAWGETESRGKGWERVFNAYFNPGTGKEIDSSALEQEVARLNESQPDSVSPPTTAKTISFTDADGERHSGRRLTEEEYNTLATVQGKTAKTILDEIIGSDAYKALTDEQKAKVFDYVYDYAREKGRTEAVQGYAGLEGWMKGIEGGEVKAILDKVMTAGFTDAFSDLTESWAKGGDGAKAVEQLEQAYRAYDGLSVEERKNFRENAGGRIGDYLTAKENGVDTQTFTELYRDYREISEDEGLDIGQRAQAWAKRLAEAQDSGEITRSAEAALKEEMAFRYTMTAETVKFDQMREMGIETEDADKVIHLLDGIVGTGSIDKNTGEPRVTDDDKWTEIAMANFLSTSEKDAIMKLYMPDYDPTDKTPDKTELRYDKMREEGFAPREFPYTHAVTTQYTKKQDIINGFKALGYNDYTARWLYDLYKNSKKVLDVG